MATNNRHFRGTNILWADDGIYVYNRSHDRYERVTNMGDMELWMQNGLTPCWIEECDLDAEDC